MSQNLFDNETFFSEYVALRERADNYNVLLEQPAMRSQLPELCGKTVLDIGCGFGQNCMDFLSLGAERVTGIDLSEKMLGIAKRKNASPQITYMKMDMADVAALTGPFDFVYSSLAFHYAENFEKLMMDIANLLCLGGELLFSQEHPLVTASRKKEGEYLFDEDGNAVAFSFSDYAYCGKRTGRWFVEGVETYHRTFSDIMNALCRAGFCIENVCEPTPSEEAIAVRPGLKKEFIKPTFFIIKAKKMDFFS